MRVTSVHKRLQLVAIFILVFILLLPMIASNVMATTVNMQDGDVSVTDTANTLKNSSGTLTATAKGSLLSKKSNTITITNKTDDTAEVSFDYNVDKASSFTIDGASAATSGSYSKLLNAGESVVIKITSNSGFSNLTVTLTLRNINLAVAAANSNVTINFDSALGSVTAGGSAIASGTTQSVSLAEGVVLEAKPNSGTTFLGWVDTEDNSVIGTTANYTLTPAQDMTVKAVFVGATSKPHFWVGASSQKSVSTGLLGLGRLYYYEAGKSYLYDDLNAAANKAASDSSNKVVTLANNGTLPAGTYTIPAGVTLLIPFDSANTMYTTQVQNTGTYAKPTEYRTLTMADGANLVINGSMSISAKQMYAETKVNAGGSPTGAVGFVKMEGNSHITVNNGGNLYAYGFITGSGSVTANSGANVYEMFQFSDFRGGSQSTDMDNDVFPLSQYYVQNIEVPMTLHSGAKEYGYTTIYMSSTDIGSDVQFIGSDKSMFNLKDGYLVKRYDGSRDRLVIDLYGDMELASVELSVATSSINSKNFDLAINGNITLNINSGSVTVKQDVALLPGVEITIAEDASMILASGYNFYVYDADQWGTFCSPANKKFIPVKYAPSQTYTRTDADLVDAKIVVNGTFDASKGHLYTTVSGANIVSDGGGTVIIKAGTQTNTHQLVQAVGYTNIPITSAKLQNDALTYTETYHSNGFSFVYCAECQRWMQTADHSCLVEYVANVELGNNLNFYFGFYIPDVTDYSGYKVIINSADSEKVTTLAYDEKPWQTTTINGKTYTYVVYTGLSAKQMIDTVVVQLIDKDGKIVDTWTDSMRNYATRLYSKTTDANLKATIETLLNYGSAAQVHFDYQSNNLANTSLPKDKQNTYGQASEQTVADPSDTFGIRGHNLVVNSNIQLHLLLDGVADNETVVVSFQDHKGNDHTINLTVISGQIVIEELVVADYQQLITVSYTVDSVTYTDTTTIEQYLTNMGAAAEGNVFRAFQEFAAAAHQYLHNKNSVQEG